MNTLMPNERNNVPKPVETWNGDPDDRRGVESIPNDFCQTPSEDHRGEEGVRMSL